MATSHSALSRPRLKDFDFGFAAAGTEASNRPELLRFGFLDHLGMIEEARDGRKFLFLGYKGSGKSALGERLVLLAKDEPQLFVRMINIADLSFQSFSQIMQGYSEPEARYPTVWSWLLLLQFFDSFAKDQAIMQHDEPFYEVEELKSLGLLPDPKLSETVRATLEKDFSLKLGPLTIGAKSSSKPNSDLPFFVERLKLKAAKFRSRNRHLIVVDGFDDLLRRRTLQYDALGALIFEAERLNDYFNQADISAKLVILCRTDLFERLPGPNNNKIRQDSAMNLEWESTSKDVRKAPLIELINCRANLNRTGAVDVFDSFLPHYADKEQKIDIRNYLLEHTRRVPRDIVMLFKRLQEHSGDGRMTMGQVFEALASYSKSYFVKEIKDELDGPVDGEDIKRAFQVFSRARKRTATMKELEAQARALPKSSSFELRKILELLFECSAVGNAPSKEAQPKDIHFKFKNPYSEFNDTQYVVFHRALWKGLDLH